MHWLWSLLESPVEDVPSLRRRINLLLAIHLVLPGASLAVLSLVLWRVKLYVTLAQRTNVETLLIGFVLVYTLYVFVTTFPATMGAVRLAWLRMRGEEDRQRALQRKAERAPRSTKRFYLNVVVRGPDDRGIELPLEDSVGRIGTLKLTLAAVTFEDVPRELTHSVVTLVVRSLARRATLVGTDAPPQVLFWDGLEAEATQAYASQVTAFHRLARSLEIEEPWPVAQLDVPGVRDLRDTVRDALPLLRECLVLPDIEYEAEFTIPVIPEPLALMQLRRTSPHADAVASMGCMTLVTLFFLAVLAGVVVHAPWVPGK